MRQLSGMLPRTVKSYLKKFYLCSSLSLRISGPLRDDGWFRSYREQSSVDVDGNPIPWITYPAIEFIKRRIDKEMSVFEYGCGGSTLWWASRVKEVVSVEHDKDWYDRIVPTIPGNVTLEYIELEYGGDYSKKVSDFNRTFDVIVIDGRDRVNCAINSIPALKSDGIIIWDNSDLKEYAVGCQFLMDNGFKKIEFIGLAPIANWKAETSLFYKKVNCFGI